MLIERLKLNDFRNYESLLLRPDSGLNVIVGENAQGKTNAVEAIFLCAFGRSHRTSKDAELIKNGMSGGYVGLELKGLSGSRIIEIKLKFGERKQIFIDRLMAKRTGELMGALNAVMFSPEDLELVKGSPITVAYTPLHGSGSWIWSLANCGLRIITRCSATTPRLSKGTRCLGRI